MSIDDHRRLHLEKKALDELRERIGRESYLSVLEVAQRLKFSRARRRRQIERGMLRPARELPWSLAQRLLEDAAENEPLGPGRPVRPHRSGGGLPPFPVPPHIPGRLTPSEVDRV